MRKQRKKKSIGADALRGKFGFPLSQSKEATFETFYFHTKAALCFEIQEETSKETNTPVCKVNSLVFFFFALIISFGLEYLVDSLVYNRISYGIFHVSEWW